MRIVRIPQAWLIFTLGTLTFLIYGTSGVQADVSFGYSSYIDPIATSDSVADTRPTLATNNQGTWVVVWQSDQSPTKLKYSYSTDGENWSASLEIPSGSTNDADDIEDQIAPAFSKDGQLALAWLSGKFHVCASSFTDLEWTTPTCKNIRECPADVTLDAFARQTDRNSSTPKLINYTDNTGPRVAILYASKDEDKDDHFQISWISAPTLTTLDNGSCGVLASAEIHEPAFDAAVAGNAIGEMRIVYETKAQENSNPDIQSCLVVAPSPGTLILEDCVALTTAPDKDRSPSIIWNKTQWQVAWSSNGKCCDPGPSSCSSPCDKPNFIQIRRLVTTSVPHWTNTQVITRPTGGGGQNPALTAGTIDDVEALIVSWEDQSDNGDWDLYFALVEAEDDELEEISPVAINHYSHVDHDQSSNSGGRTDHATSITTDGSGTWIAAWDSSEPEASPQAKFEPWDNIGKDADIIVTRPGGTLSGSDFFTLSPDGENVYASSRLVGQKGGVIAYRRDRQSGLLELLGSTLGSCEDPTECNPINPLAITVTPDGLNAYATATNHTIIRYERVRSGVFRGMLRCMGATELTSFSPSQIVSNDEYVWVAGRPNGAVTNNGVVVLERAYNGELQQVADHLPQDSSRNLSHGTVLRGQNVAIFGDAGNAVVWECNETATCSSQSFPTPAGWIESSPDGASLYGAGGTPGVGISSLLSGTGDAVAVAGATKLYFLAATSSRLYVAGCADSNSPCDGGVWSLNPTGQPANTPVNKVTGLNDPASVIASRDGQYLYVFERGVPAIRVYDESMNQIQTVPSVPSGKTGLKLSFDQQSGTYTVENELAPIDVRLAVAPDSSCEIGGEMFFPLGIVDTSLSSPWPGLTGDPTQSVTGVLAVPESRDSCHAYVAIVPTSGLGVRDRPIRVGTECGGPTDNEVTIDLSAP